MIRAPSLVSALAAIGAAACGAPDVGAPGGLAGPDVTLDWSVRPLVAIGGAAAVDETAWGEVAGVAFDGAGRLYVLDGDARRVVVVDTTGAVRATMGVPGEGPGRLASAGGLVVGTDGRVLVLDAARRRFVAFEPDGSAGPAVPIADSLPLPAGPLAVHRGEWIVGTDAPGLTEAGVPPPPTRPLVLHPADPAAGARVPWRGWSPPVPRSRSPTADETGGMRVRLAPLVGFHPRLLTAPLPDGRLAVVDSVDWRVRLVRLDGSTDAALVRPLEPAPVTDAVRDAERARRRGALDADAPQLVRSTADGVRSEVADDAVRRLQEARIDAMGFHDVVPVVDALRVDPAGRIWVARTPVPPATRSPVDIVTADGGYVGTLPADGPPLPAAFGPRGLVAHLGRDDLGAPVIRIGRLIEQRS